MVRLMTPEEVDKILSNPGEAKLEDLTAAFDNSTRLKLDIQKKDFEASLTALEKKYETLKEQRSALASRITGDPKIDAERAFWACGEEIQAWLVASMEKDFNGMRHYVDKCTDKLSSLGYDDVPLGNLRMSHIAIKELHARAVGSPFMRKSPRMEGEKTAATTGTDTGLVPQVFVPYLIDRFYYFSAFRPKVTIIPITSTGAKIPGVYAGLTATYRATEATASTDSSLSTESLTPAILPYSASCEISRALIQSGLPIPLLEYYLTQLVDAINVLEWKMFITGDGTSDWTCGLANISKIPSQTMTGAQLAGFNGAISQLGGEYELPQAWADSLAWVVKRSQPPILIEKTKTSIGTYLNGMIDLEQCMGYPWMRNYACDLNTSGTAVPGVGYFVAMKAFFLFEMPDLMRLGTTTEGSYAMKDSVGMFLHTYTDGMLGTYKREAENQAAVKLTDLPTSM